MGIAFRAWAVLMRVVSSSSLWLHVKTCSRCFCVQAGHAQSGRLACRGMETQDGPIGRACGSSCLS